MPSNRAKKLDLRARVLEVSRQSGLEDVLLSAPLVVGVSGGTDSLALLYLLAELRGERASETLHVAHLDHGFRGEEAANDALFVEETAAGLGFSYTGAYFDVRSYAKRARLSPEDGARQVRYAFLASIAAEKRAAIAVAHTADDQVETILMHIIRGAGIHGLVGMQPLSQLTVPPIDVGSRTLYDPSSELGVSIFRPLLSIWRSEILLYCQAHRLEPRQDTTNMALDYQRNRIRHKLLPALRDHFGQPALARILDLSNISAAEDSLVQALSDTEWESVACVGNDQTAVTIDLASFASLHVALRRRLVRKAIAIVGGTLDDVSFQHITRAVGVISGGPGSPRAMDLPLGITVVREDDKATLRARTAGSPHDDMRPEDAVRWPTLLHGERIPLPADSTLRLGSGWQLVVNRVPVSQAGEPGDLVALFDREAIETLGPLELRTRRAGDVIRPVGLQGSKSLHDLFVDAKIPRRARSRIALLCRVDSNEVIWAPGPGGRRSEYALVQPDTTKVFELEFKQLAL